MKHAPPYTCYVFHFCIFIFTIFITTQSHTQPKWERKKEKKNERTNVPCICLFGVCELYGYENTTRYFNKFYCRWCRQGMRAARRTQWRSDEWCWLALLLLRAISVFADHVWLWRVLFFRGGVVVVVVWHIIRPVSMWSRNAESQCHSVLRYANLSLAQSYRSLRQWPFWISRSLQFNERFYRKCSINLFLHTHDRWIFELMMDETAIVPMIMAIYCNFLFPKMHSMTAGNAGTS